MRPLPLSQQTKETPYELILDTFKGTATVLDDVIAGKEYAKESTNLLQVQDGRWKNRWGRAYWGTAITGETEIYGVGNYTKSDGTRELVAITSSGKAYKSQDGEAWTEITGATFDVSAKNPHFKQINNFLFISNGVDRLTRYNGSVLSRYTAITAPVGTSGSRGAGLSAGSNNNFYKITALNDIGETEGSAEISVTTNKLRDAWNVASNEYVDLSWTAVAGATRYQIWYSEVTGDEQLLTETATNSFRDDATFTINEFYACPTDNTTGAPKFSMIATSGGRIWGIAPEEYKWRVFWSGTGQFLGTFSYSYGGGYQDLDYGSDEIVSFIEHSRTGKGDNAATIFTANPRGGGSVWQMQITSITVGSDTIMVPVFDKVVGSTGTKARGAALLVGDAIVFLSAYGVQTLTNKQNVANVLSTETTSREIQPSYMGLNWSLASQWRAYQYRNFTIITATEGTGENDITFLRDNELDRWYWKWTFGARGFFEYTDNNGVTRLLHVPTSGNRLVEISENIVGDFGQAIKTSLLTGLIPIDRDKYIFAKVKEALLDIGRPKGSITFEVLGISAKKGFETAGNREITDTLQVSEFWTGSLGEITLKDEEDAPTTYSQASVRKTLRIRKELNSIQFHVYSDSLETEYTVLSIQAKGTIKNRKAPSTWRR